MFASTDRPVLIPNLAVGVSTASSADFFSRKFSATLKDIFKSFDPLFVFTVYICYKNEIYYEYFIKEITKNEIAPKNKCKQRPVRRKIRICKSKNFRVLFYDYFYQNTNCERVSGETSRTSADGHVVLHAAVGTGAAGEAAWVDATIIFASLEAIKIKLN